MIRMRKHPESLPPSEGNRMSGRHATPSPRKQREVRATGQMRLRPHAGAGGQAAGDSRRGMVLLTVLWTIALLSALAMAAAVSFRGFAGIAAVGRDREQRVALHTVPSDRSDTGESAKAYRRCHGERRQQRDRP